MKRLLVNTAFAIALPAVLVMLTACPMETRTYTVEYDGNGATSGTVPEAQTKTEGVDIVIAGNTGNLARTHDYFVGWNTQPDGNGTDYAAGSPYMSDEDITLYASWEPFQVGGAGPAGGFVFYDKGSFADGWRYLEAAPAETEWVAKPWGGYGTIVDGTEDAIGSGAANTQAIVAEFQDSEPYADREDYAARLCADLVHGGHDDWFLPSRDELELMYENLHIEGIGGFAGTYWSSSEVDFTGFEDVAAKTQDFDDGSKLSTRKDIGRRVRAARAF